MLESLRALASCHGPNQAGAGGEGKEGVRTLTILVVGTLLLRRPLRSALLGEGSREGGSGGYREMVEFYLLGGDVLIVLCFEKIP